MSIATSQYKGVTLGISLSLVPSSTTINPGESVDVDVHIGGRGNFSPPFHKENLLSRSKNRRRVWEVKCNNGQYTF